MTDEGETCSIGLKEMGNMLWGMVQVRLAIMTILVKRGVGWELRQKANCYSRQTTH